MLFVELKQAHNAEGRYVISLALCPSNPHTLTSFVTMFLAAWLVPAASKCLWIYWRGGLGATEWRLWESCYEVAAITELSNCMLHLQVCLALWMCWLISCFKYVCRSQSLSLMHYQNKRNQEKLVSNAATHIHPFSHILTCRNLYYCSEIFEKDKGWYSAAW